MAALTLTTDEVVAVAALHEKPWPTPFALADSAAITADDARATVRRGARSLVVRGLLAMTDGRAVLADEVVMPLSRMDSGCHVVVYPARGGELTDALYPLLYVHPGDDGQSVVELDAGDGIRGITTMATSAVADHLRTTLRSVFRRQDAGDRPVVHVGTVRPDRREVTVIGPGEVTSMTVAPDGSTVHGGTSPFFDPALIDTVLRPAGTDEREQSA